MGKSLNEFSLIEDQTYYLDGLFNLLKTEDADALIIAGDIYDRAVPPAEAVTLFDDFLCRVTQNLKTKIFAISGNHDSSKRLSFASKLVRSSGLYLESIYNKKIAKFSLEDEFGDVNFYLLPYVSPPQIQALFNSDENQAEIKNANDALKAIINCEEFDFEKRNVLISHGFYGYSKENDELESVCALSDSETRVGTIDICDAKILKKFDYVALGHIHSSQKVGAEHIRYSGSLLKYSISEQNQKKSVTVIEMNEKNDLKIISKSIPILRDLKVCRGEFQSFLDGEINKDINKEDYIFFELTDKDNILDPMNKLRAVYNRVLGLKFVEKESGFNKTSLAENIISKSIINLYEDFYKAVTEEELEDYQKEIMQNVFKNIADEENQ